VAKDAEKLVRLEPAQLYSMSDAERQPFMQDPQRAIRTAEVNSKKFPFVMKDSVVRLCLGCNCYSMMLAKSLCPMFQRLVPL
jgi:hypothetical protein